VMVPLPSGGPAHICFVKTSESIAVHGTPLSVPGSKRCVPTVAGMWMVRTSEPLVSAPVTSSRFGRELLLSRAAVADHGTPSMRALIDPKVLPSVAGAGVVGVLLRQAAKGIPIATTSINRGMCLKAVIMRTGGYRIRLPFP
jgi:hypothetical protein